MKLASEVSTVAIVLCTGQLKAPQLVRAVWLRAVFWSISQLGSSPGARSGPATGPRRGGAGSMPAPAGGATAECFVMARVEWIRQEFVPYITR
jgi:hypothetical protein